MSGQHCQSYDIKRETVHCYPVTSSLLTAVARNGWNLSAVFKFCSSFVLLYNKSLNDCSLGEQWILFPSNLDVSLDFVSGNTEILGKQIYCSLRDQSLSVKCCFLFENSTQYSNWNAAIWLAELLVHFVVAVGCLTKGDVSSFSRSFEGKFKCKRIIRLVRLKTNRRPLTKTWNYGKDGRTHAESCKFLMSIHFRAILGKCKV